MLKYKTALRAAEALAACRFMGIPSERVHFLNLPFYETGSVKKNLLGKEDIDIIVNLLREVKPHQIYAAAGIHSQRVNHSRNTKNSANIEYIGSHHVPHGNPRYIFCWSGHFSKITRR